MESVIPAHINHTLSEVMCQKSQVFPLPIMLKNEAKYEDCIDILDGYEDQLIKLYTSAHGQNDNNLVKLILVHYYDKSSNTKVMNKIIW